MSDPNPRASADDPPPLPPGPSGPPFYAQLTAGVLLLLYVGLTVAMMLYFNTKETWDHALLIYNGFTAFALAAAGVLLGTQVQQATANAARRESLEARAEAARVRQAALAALAATNAPPAPSELKAVRDLLTKAL